MMNTSSAPASPAVGSLTPADAFILDLLRAEFGGGTPNVAAPAAPPPPGWDAVVRRAAELGIGPLLYGIVRGRTGTAIPEHRARDLGMEYAKTWAMNAKNMARIAELLAAFGPEGIRAILLKGAHLAAFVYLDIGMRPMADVDILVRKEDIPAAEKLLAGAGYAMREHVPAAYKFLDADGGAPAPEHLTGRYRECHHHLHPLGSARGIRLLDVHWTLVPPSLPFPIDAEGLWQRAGIKAVEGREVRVLCPEDTILHLALHASFRDKFRLHGLRSLCDLAAVVGRFHDTIDWAALSARARDWNAGRFVYLALRLSRDLPGARIPEEALALLRPADFDEAIAGEAARRILGGEDRRAAIRRPEMFDPSRGLGAKTAYVLGRIFPRPGEIARIYSLPPSSPRVYLRYPRRLASLISRYPALYARFFLHLLRGERPDPFGYNLDTWLSEGSVRGLPE
jgi:hypothetical protein